MVLKCKICGGDIEVGQDKCVGTCLYCGTKQALPKLVSEKKANLYDRAAHFQGINEFDKAQALYEQILAEDNTDAEIYWDIVLCRYGIEYVEDTKTHERIPTVNRTQYQSIFEDKDYQSAIQYASDEQRKVFEESAKTIDAIQSDILEISNKETPYDVFICYKEADNAGRRTQDSVIAQELYTELTREGYKVFFSRITLEDKLGSAYEPYIFAALNSAKVMVCVGTRPEYFQAVWVKNEWSRFLSLIKNGEKKVLIPAYRDMDPYDLPEEFAHLQAQDMSKLGFMQDLVRGIKKIIMSAESKQNENSVGLNIAAYKKRIRDYLDIGDYKNAMIYSDIVLDEIPEDAETHILKLCAEMEVKDQESLKLVNKSFEKSHSYQNILKYASPEQKAALKDCLEEIEKRVSKRKKRYVIITGAIVVAVVIAVISSILLKQRAERLRLEAEVKHAEELIDSGEYQAAMDIITSLGDTVQIDPQLVDYIDAGLAFQREDYKTAEEIYKKNQSYKDSSKMALQCEYHILANDFDQIEDYDTVKKTLEEMIASGVEDTEDISGQLEYKEKLQEFENSYKNKNIKANRGCRYILQELMELDADLTKQFVEDNQEKWYNDAYSIVLDAENKTDVDKYFRLRQADDFFSLCESNYKDVQVYRDIWNARNDINVILDKAKTNKMASVIAWCNFNDWMPGIWKTSDGKKYFEYKKDGSTTYNIPYVDLPNSYYAISTEGVYYLYGKDGARIMHTENAVDRKDVFKFTIINKRQMEVYCYKDKSSYLLYKQ
ncbi:MAG: TIR domain-containing protein [Lachnospiraceae bacterium]|nr:TIR domain-containing protein [Lachnospiraceae bacterium]